MKCCDNIIQEQGREVRVERDGHQEVVRCEEESGA